MAITNFIPTIWSENLLTALDKKYIAVSHCNREYVEKYPLRTIRRQ